MDEALKVAVDFVEGRISEKEFEKKLYSDPDLEKLLADSSLNWHSTYIKSTPYDYLIGLDFNDPGDICTAQGALELFLNKRGIAFRHATVHLDLLDILRDSQPKWLDVDPAYVKDHILPKAGQRQGNELKDWLKARFRQLFRCHKKPPSWIQNPAWPINEHGPLYFLGQIKIENCSLFHDDGALYVFLDAVNGSTATLTQLY
ncbi:MAG: hypothetical protein FJ271_04270 [Planctomycetes bacterium]|nr:hypothetical protein [Planctomycetota bacterium]